MSERDEPEAKATPGRRRRRSLRVPVDEVPRPTQGAPVDGSSTLLEMPAFEDDGRMTLHDARSPVSEPPAEPELELETETETETETEPELETEPLDELEEAALEEEALEEEALEEHEALHQERDEAALDAEIEEEPLQHDAEEREAAEDAAPASAGAAEEQDGGEVEASEAKIGEPTSSASAAGAADADPTPATPAVVSPPAVVGVVVQRVVSVVSAPSSTPPPPPEPPPEAVADGASGEVPVDVDDDEPELRIGEPDAGELEELDVDVDEGAEEHRAAAAAREEPPSPTPEPRDSAPELTHEEAEELLELEEAQARADGKKRPSKPPPPPPSTGKAKEPPPREPPPPEAPRRKKARRQWWEDLFNDDYLRTVPIPHPRVISRQCDFIEQRFGLGRGATMLDVGCGLGLHAVELTRRGYLVVGLDLSLPMLARAADEAQDSGFKINFLHGDMREMNFDGAFDAVLSYGTTFGYFDDEVNKQVVDRLYRSLKPRGLLLLEVVNRDFVIRSQPNLVWFEGDGCVVMEESQMNYITSRLEVKRTVILDDGRQRENLYSIRTYSLHELGQILHHQGFRVVEVSGWEAHPGVFFGGDSPKIIILAERRPAGPPVPPSRSASAEASSSEGEDVTSGEGRAESAEAAKPEPSEPSAEVSEAVAAALSSSEALAEERDELDAEELADEDLEAD